MKESLVPKHLVLQIREQYRDNRISQASLAKRYGLSETTIHRIVNELGAYQMASPAIIPKDELDRLADESLRDLQARLAGSPSPTIPDILLADEKPAGNPADRLAKEVDKMAEPDRLLNELTKKEGS